MCSVHVTGANWMKTLSRSHDTVRLCSLAATSFANVLFHFIDFSLQSYTFYADFSSCHIQWRRNSLPAVLQLHTLFAKDGSASLGKWHARALNRIAVGSLERRSDRPVIGGNPRTRTWLGHFKNVKSSFFLKSEKIEKYVFSNTGWQCAGALCFRVREVTASARKRTNIASRAGNARRRQKQ